MAGTIAIVVMACALLGIVLGFAYKNTLAIILGLCGLVGAFAIGMQGV